MNLEYIEEGYGLGCGNLLPVISVAPIDVCPSRHVLKGRGLPLRACAHGVQGRASLAPLPLCVWLPLPCWLPLMPAIKARRCAILSLPYICIFCLARCSFVSECTTSCCCFASASSACLVVASSLSLQLWTDHGNCWPDFWSQFKGECCIDLQQTAAVA